MLELPVSVTVSLQITPGSIFNIYGSTPFSNAAESPFSTPVDASQIFKCDLNMQAESGSKFRLCKLIRKCDHIKCIKVYNRVVIFSTCLLTVQEGSFKSPRAFFP